MFSSPYAAFSQKIFGRIAALSNRTLQEVSEVPDRAVAHNGLMGEKR